MKETTFKSRVENVEMKGKKRKKKYLNKTSVRIVRSMT